MIMLSRVVRPALLGFCLVLASAVTGQAASETPSHGIAMHGAPKYAENFSHLDYADPGAPKGGTIRHGVTGSFDSLNPWIVKGRAAAGLIGPQVFESLMARVWDEPFSLYGLIAETIAVPDDRSSVTFVLRPEARWHDGRPITVDDILFSWETLRTKGRPNHRSAYAKVAEAARVGDRGVRFVFKPGDDGAIDREMPLIMGLMPILPKHYWEGRTFDATTLEPPLGSGPYRIAAVDPGRSITYERVPDYWGKDLPINRGQHNFDRIRYDYYRDDGVALEAFKAGEYDFRRETDATKWATGYDFPAVAKGDVRLELLPHGRPDWMRALIFNTRRPIFADIRVREALGYALDFEWMNRTLFHGAFKRTQSYFPNSELAATGVPAGIELEALEPWRAELPPELFTTPFEPPSTDGGGNARANLRMAARLLGEAGWVVRDGRLVDAQSGRPFTFEILLNDPSSEKVALEFSRALRRLGIEASVRTVDGAQFQQRLEAFDYDMTLYRWISTLSPGNEQLFYWGSRAADQPGSRNYAGIKSAAVDAIAASIATASDRETLVARTRALDRTLLWGHYAIPLYYQGEDRVAYWTPLRRPETTPLYGLIIETWWAEPRS